MNIDNAAHVLETIVSLGVLGVLWKLNRIINQIWDALQSAPPHAHFGKRIWYPPPFKAPHTEAMDLQNGSETSGH